MPTIQWRACYLEIHMDTPRRSFLRAMVETESVHISFWIYFWWSGKDSSVTMIGVDRRQRISLICMVSHCNYRIAMLPNPQKVRSWCRSLTDGCILSSLRTSCSNIKLSRLPCSSFSRLKSYNSDRSDAFRYLAQFLSTIDFLQQKRYITLKHSQVHLSFWLEIKTTVILEDWM